MKGRDVLARETPPDVGSRRRSRVAVLKTTPESVLEDYGRLMRLANYRAALSVENELALKANISWHHFFPGCSTTPWQLEGVIQTLLADGYSPEQLYACHNRTVVVSAKLGERRNKLLPVVKKYGLRNIHLYEQGRWVRYRPRAELRVLDRIYPDGIHIPEILIGSNVIHLPTAKTHVFTTMTGAMKNAFGGLLNEKRHWTHGVIHDALVDLLAIQKEIHRGIFAVTDGTFAGDGPGPRCMTPHVKGYVFASADQVAIDAVVARVMGFDPLTIPFIRLAHESGLGCGDTGEVEVCGEDVAEASWNFRRDQNTFASRGQKLIYHGPLRFLEKLLLRTWLVPWAHIASIAYHDCYWYPVHGRRRVKEMMATEWGRLFQKY